MGPRPSGDRSLRVIRCSASLTSLEVVPKANGGRCEGVKLRGELELYSCFGSGLAVAPVGRSDRGVLIGDCFSGERDLARSTKSKTG